MFDIRQDSDIAQKSRRRFWAVFSAGSSESLRISGAATSVLLETTIEHRGVFCDLFPDFFACSRLGFLCSWDKIVSTSGRGAGETACARASRAARRRTQARLCDEVERVLREEIPKNELQTILDNIGLPNSRHQPVLQFEWNDWHSDDRFDRSDPEHHHQTTGGM